MNPNPKAILLILDGWGIGNQDSSDAIYKAHTPFTDSLYKQYPNSTLLTCGPHVGLPEGQMGNSEVGHLNIGAGRVVWQMLEKINQAFTTNNVSQIPEWNQLIHYCTQNQKPLHLLGLLSNGGVHSSIEHLFKLIELAVEHKVPKVYVHAFTDGRDTDPQSGIGFLADLIGKIHQYPQVALSSITGRYYAMDRDKRMERTAKAYFALTQGKGIETKDPIQTIKNLYEEGITDEFIPPIIIKQNTPNLPTIQANDAVLFFNFRTDRGRQLTQALTQQAFPDVNTKPLPLFFTTLTEYDSQFKQIRVLFKTENLKNTLGEVLANHNLKQIRAAETEKYPHVTYFFSGGREQAFANEQRILVASPKVATYDLKPEMSAIELTQKVCNAIQESEAEFICINLANPDMVGHTGVFEAIVKAVETVDQCVKQIVEAGLKSNYSLLITADHGNADLAKNPDQTPNTAHSLNPVPIWLITPQNLQINSLQSGSLADVAPTLLKLLQIPQPKEMTGNALF